MHTMKTVFCLLFGLAVSASSAEWPKGIKAPAGWEVTMFAAPTNVGYPTCLSTAPNGDLYVGVDENGSLDAKPNRGRVVRCTDTDGDGKADKFTTFATMDSPRGIWFENNVLYVEHPPFVTAYFDDNGDGVSDRSEAIVKGLGFDLKFRGADHTMNGMRMGIDGFLYIACGDYGATNAVGQDGTAIKLHGGGVVRVRPDGTGLEIVSHGQRNIYDVAVSPEMDLFTRDNTNDGDGWNVRLSHVLMGGKYGYPSLYKKFGDEMVQPLADYGGGSPCGALFMDEPGFPEGFGRGLYTVEWGANAIMRHPLTNNGASWKAGQSKFVELQRPTDFDVDGSGRLYIASWQGATFNYAGPNAGYVVRVTPPGWKLAAFPDLKKAGQAELLKLVGSPSAFARLYAQREILRRDDSSSYVGPLETLAASTAPTAPRAAAIFTLDQLPGAAAQAALLRLAKNDEVREFALRALADSKAAAAVPAAPFVSALTDANPRVRLQAVTALGRLGKAEAASGILPLVADSDPMVAHLAVQSLAKLGAAKVCLAAFDSPGTTNLLYGAGRALELQHAAAVVDGLIERLAKTTDAATRQIILKALCRLYTREDDWNGKWWGTRPDSTGPYFKPVKWAESEKIAAALRDSLAKADPETLRALMLQMQRNRVDLPEATAAVLRLAATDAKFRAQAIEMFSGRPVIPDEAISFFGQIALSGEEAPATRVKAVRALQRSGKPAALDAAVAALTASEKPPGELAAAWEEFAREPKQSQNLARFVKLAESGSPGERTLGYAVLGSLASVKVSSKETKASASRALEQAWAKPETAAPLLQAIARLKLEQFAFQVRALTSDPRPAVAAAAKQTAQSLGLDKKPAGETGALIEKLPYDEVVATAVKDKGDAKIGAKFFLSLGCVACHTVSSDEAPKGPFLGGIAARYSRADLCESIIKPGAKIAQGFETQTFKTKEGDELEGFVTREGGDDLDLRNMAGITTTLAKKDIKDRGKRDTSAMPQGLADKLTPAELASLLAYLESLKAK